ncbi:hypothetical protein [Streptomyces sp. NPDC005181]|uniref:hypothetical protein n=1 Tax=Streptomyces sp. NPDC005181 TaxID=3156869 RepID=UPI0033BE2246
MSMLFAPVRQALGDGGDTQAIGLRRGVGNIDYFDRCMVFGVPNDDLPETAFELGLQHLADDVPSTEKDELLMCLRDDTQRITRRIQYERITGAPVPAAALLKAAAQQYGHLTAAPQGVFNLLTADRSMDVLASDLLTDLSEAERPILLQTMASTPDGAFLAAHTLQRATPRAASDGPDHTQTPAVPAWISEARSLTSHELARHLTPAAGRPVHELTELEITLIWAWRHTEPQNAQAWINQCLDDSWPPLDLLTVLVPPDRARFPVIDNDTLHSLDALIGLDDLYSRLGPLLDAPAADPTNPHDEHQERILQALREHRQRNSSNAT